MRESRTKHGLPGLAYPRLYRITSGRLALLIRYMCDTCIPPFDLHTKRELVDLCEIFGRYHYNDNDGGGGG